MKKHEIEALQALADDFRDVGMKSRKTGLFNEGYTNCAKKLESVLDYLTSIHAPDEGLREGLEKLVKELTDEEDQLQKVGDCLRAERTTELIVDIKELLAKTPDPWKPIADAPRDEEILAFNTVTGWYKTKYQNVKDAEWPCHEWNGKTGIWYPQPTHYMRMPAPPREEET